MPAGLHSMARTQVCGSAVQGTQDQTFTGGNAALLRNIEQGKPVRVIRKKK